MPRFSVHDLAATIDARAASGGEASYTRKLLDKGTEHCAKKLGEEAVELPRLQRHRRVVAQTRPLLTCEDAIGIVLLVSRPDIHDAALLFPPERVR